MRGGKAIATTGDLFATHDPAGEERRRKVDPELRYGAAGLRAFERHALAIVMKNRDAMVERTRDAIQITLKRAPSVVLLVTLEALEVRFPVREWTDTGDPAATSILWKGQAWNNLADADVPALVREARRQIQTRLSGSNSFALEAHGPALMEACHRLARETKRTRDAEVRLTFSDGIFLLHLPHAGVGVPASGDWPGEVWVSTDLLRAFAEAPLDMPVVPVAYNDGRAKIGTFTVLATYAMEAL